MSDFAAVRLTLARERERGSDFAQAWQVTLAAPPVPAGKTLAALERQEALGALRETEDAWRTAYERAGTSGQGAR